MVRESTQARYHRQMLEWRARAETAEAELSALKEAWVVCHNHDLALNHEADELAKQFPNKYHTVHALSQRDAAVARAAEAEKSRDFAWETQVGWRARAEKAEALVTELAEAGRKMRKHAWDLNGKTGSLKHQASEELRAVLAKVEEARR